MIARAAGMSRASASSVLQVNWAKADRQGKLKSADSEVVSTEQMEISRLGAELARMMERDILGKATAYFATAQS